ncbi:MAG: N-acetyl-gamma-glutamyl-phosphate reductase [Chloroflexota bacterium]
MRAAIINVTGYAGVDLARLLSRHPHVRLAEVTGRSQAGQRLKDVFPHLGRLDLTIRGDVADADVIFSALPHKASAEVLAPLVGQGRKLIDVAADFRLHDRAEYEQTYEVIHPAPHLLAQAVYGLPELHAREIGAAELVANPGCYPTGAILALAPAIKHGLIEPDVIVDAKSGASGAGRNAKLEYSYSEMNESVSAYALRGHRHRPEIRQELTSLSDEEVHVTFVPHLIPMTRGILTTCYARLRRPVDQDELRMLYRDFYRDSPFTRLVDTPPQTKWTAGSNECLLYPTVDQRENRLIALAVLDNLVKGAAGQAVQNMNLMCGFDQTCGLEQPALYP